MEQKNTIIKCKAHPNCLFNYNGICDNYVIIIGTDGKCQECVETARVEERKKIAIYKPGSKEPLLILDEPQRGQRAKCNFISDGIDQEIVDEVCKPFDIKHPTAETNQWKAKYDCYTCLHNDHGEYEFNVKPMITPQGRCCRYEV